MRDGVDVRVFGAFVKVMTKLYGNRGCNPEFTKKIIRLLSEAEELYKQLPKIEEKK